jgi:hypothetical protein
VGYTRAPLVGTTRSLGPRWPSRYLVGRVWLSDWKGEAGSRQAVSEA